MIKHHSNREQTLVQSLNLNVRNDVLSTFPPTETVLQNSLIFRIHIPLTLLKAFHFNSFEGLEGIVEYVLNFKQIRKQISHISFDKIFQFLYEHFIQRLYDWIISDQR